MLLNTFANSFWFTGTIGNNYYVAALLYSHSYQRFD